MTNLQQILKEARKKYPISHYSCEDSWYSCPEAEDGCSNDSSGEKCNCGYYEKIKILDSLISKAYKAGTKEKND